MQRSSDVTVEECADTVDLVIGKAEQLFACPGSGEQDGGVRFHLHTGRQTRQPPRVAFARALASSAPSCPARAPAEGVKKGEGVSKRRRRR